MSAFDLFVLASIVVFALAWLGVVLRRLSARDETRRAPGPRTRRFVADIAQRLEMNREDERLEGRLDPDDREASVMFVKDEEPHAVFAVEVRTAPRVRFTLETASTRFAKALGYLREIEVGDPAFDALFLIETHDPRARKHLARGRELREKIVAVFERYGVESLEVRRNKLLAKIPLAALRKGDYARLLDLLAATARAFDRVGIKVKVLGSERLAVAGAQGKPRCAYCHADVTGDEPDLVACETCGTVLHEACWSELGRCPLLGCTGERPEKAREGNA